MSVGGSQERLLRKWHVGLALKDEQMTVWEHRNEGRDGYQEIEVPIKRS